ncbi:uncharacterized protein LOC125492951 [Beta vulgaris subsp. vulgaris]|uniref:uncharacterized protein LOC125492951 n=1 Tax=Beta vulgaris subsp. vulgaris TaxID=3555 RepID=UPI002036F791|nr:uncharacterized protein LOC125492951 [Beta vulgaris subsp. vulgaris]
MLYMQQHSLPIWKRAGVHYYCTTSELPIIWGDFESGPNISILQAEAWGLKEGLSAALSLNISNLEIEGDNLAVINVVRKIWKVPWEINNIILDVNANLLKFDNFQVHHCFREANKTADLMAHQGHSHSDLAYNYPPYDIDFSLFIRNNVLGWPPN